jgi:hypothetical protein
MSLVVLSAPFTVRCVVEREDTGCALAPRVDDFGEFPC